MQQPQNIQLLLAVLVPLIGAGLVMLNGKRPNVRETISGLSAATLFLITARYDLIHKQTNFLW